MNIKRDHKVQRAPTMMNSSLFTMARVNFESAFGIGIRELLRAHRQDAIFVVGILPDETRVLHQHGNP